VNRSASMRSFGHAARMHSLEHDGYLPTAGWQWDTVNEVADPEGLDDKAEKRYMYYTDEGTKRPLPVTAALGHYLGVRTRSDSRQHLEEDLHLESLRRLFRCGSQTEERWGISQRGDSGGSWAAPDEESSYGFNE